MDAAGSKSGRRKPGRAVAPAPERSKDRAPAAKAGQKTESQAAAEAAVDKGKSKSKGKATGKGKTTGTDKVSASSARPSAAQPKAKAAAAPVMTKGSKGVIEVSVAAKPAAAPKPAGAPRPAAAPKPAAPTPSRESAPSAEKPAKPGPQAAPGEPNLPLPIDMEKLTQVSTEILTESGKAGAAMLKALETGDSASLVPDEGAEIAKTLGAVAQYWLQDPKRLVEAQKNISLDLITLWNATLHQVNGEKPDPVAAMPARDARFADPEWNEHPYFNFLKQAYVLGSNWVQGLVDKAETLDDHTRLKATF